MGLCTYYNLLFSLAPFIKTRQFESSVFEKYSKLLYVLGKFKFFKQFYQLQHYYKILSTETLTRRQNASQVVSTILLLPNSRIWKEQI